MFLTTGHALNTIAGNKYHFLLIIPILIYFFCVLYKKINLDIYLLIEFLLLFTWAFALILILGGSVSYILKFLLVIFFSLVIVRVYNFEVFRKNFVKAMVIIAVISLVGHVYFVYINPFPPLPIITNVTGIKYYNALLFFDIVGKAGGRNMGCFWEPGIFGSFLVLAIMFSILDNNKVQVFDIIILSVTVFTSQSTAAYLLYILALCLLFVKTIKKITIRKIVLLFILGGIIACIFMNINDIFNYLLESQPRVFSKLVNETASSTMRAESPFVNFEIFMEHPILGVGLDQVGKLYSSANISQTSTTTYLMASFGIIGVLVTIFQGAGILFYKRWNVISRIIVFVVFFSIINKEPHMFFTITWIISFYFIRDFFSAKQITRKEGSFEYKNTHC
ncbi:MAG: O-antigen ligase family protein [Lachnospiraceae bacterium]